MKLSVLLENAVSVSEKLAETEISGITDDSRKVNAGSLFVCIKGDKFDGHSVAGKMLEQGAAAVVVERDLQLGERQILVKDSRNFYGKLCAAWFGHPERKMRFIGVTGTNGKTTITNLIKRILTANGHKVGLIGTIQNEIGEEVIHTDNTTPFTFELMQLYEKMYQSGCDTVVMEVSSFGLVQKRIGETHFDIAVFTNLTQDHLDYHHTMENYYQAKKLLFSVCDKAVIYSDDEYGKRLYQEITCEKYYYGSTGEYCCKPISVKASGAEFFLNQKKISLQMTGYFNIANATAAYAVCELFGLEEKQILPALTSCTGISSASSAQ